jgi:hypothetical protein
MSLKIKIGLHRSLYLFIDRKQKKDNKSFSRFIIRSYLAITH